MTEHHEEARKAWQALAETLGKDYQRFYLCEDETAKMLYRRRPHILVDAAEGDDWYFYTAVGHDDETAEFIFADHTQNENKVVMHKGQLLQLAKNCLRAHAYITAHE